MNDHTPDQDRQHNDEPVGMDPRLESRLRAHLNAGADRVEIPEVEPQLVRHTARQRTIRRHRAVVGTVAAATVVAMVVGVQALSSSGGDRIRTTDGASDASATDDAAAPATTIGDSPSTPLIAAAAQLGEPAFVWKVVEADQSQSIVSTFNGGGTQSFPGLAVSTSPGRSNDYDNATPSVWRTTDGVSWEQTDLGLPFGNNRLWESVGSEGLLFAVGTAPGIAATDPNPLQVAVAGIDSTDWTVSELPVDTNGGRDLPFVVNGINRSIVPVDGGVLVAVTASANLNVVELDEASDAFDMDRLMEVGPDGIKVADVGCDPADYAPASTVVGYQNPAPIVALPAATSTTVAGDAPTGTVPSENIEPDSTAADSSACPLVQLTWDELGVPAESVAALRGNTTTFFQVAADGTVTPVESPVPGSQFTPAGGSLPDFVVTDNFGNWATDGSMYRFSDGGWQTLPMTFNNWAMAPLRLGDATVGFGYPTGETPVNGPLFAEVGDDGTATFVDTTTLFGQYAMVSANSAAVAAGHWVAPVSVTRDELAAAGGAEFTIDGLTVRQTGIGQPPVFIDAASGDQIPESDLVYGNDNTISARDAAGEVIGTVTWDEVYNRLSAPYETSQADAEWSIITTADGTTFARESIAELLGVDPSAISFVPRVYSDGTQMVVVVTLNDRYPDDSRKQVALVGTPIG